MSRYVKSLEKGRSIAYGHDLTIGYFFDLFGSPDENGDCNLIISESSLLTKMSRGELIELMDLFDLPESQIELVAMDLPI